MASKDEMQLYDRMGTPLKGQHYDPVTGKFVEGNGITAFSPLLNFEDTRGFGKSISAGAVPVRLGRIPTTTDGVFLNNGNVNLAPNGTTGAKGDFLRNVRGEIKTVSSGGKAGIFITQLSDPVFGTGTTGSAITATTTQTLTSGTTLPATKNQLADRAVSFLYTPTGLSPMWVTTRIVSHAAISTTSIALTLEDTPEAGSAPTSWIIHGVKARRILDPATAAGPFDLQLNLEAEVGGFVAWIGSGVMPSDFFGVFSG